MEQEREDMSRHEALRIAMSEMSLALDEIAQMPEEDVKYLKTPPEAIQEAMRVIDQLMREM